MASSIGRTIVIALGGNAIAPPGDDNRFEAQLQQTAETCRQLVPLIRDGHRVVITHGNGPQVGHSLRRVELAAGHVPTLPLDVCVAETQGMIGHMIAQCLRNALHDAGISRPVSTMVTTVLVSADDPAMTRPTKPIGREYSPEEAQSHRVNGWKLQPMPNGKFRRVVASPAPREIIELPVIKRLVDAGDIVIACGGGGIPVVRNDVHGCVGVPAVIDKDLASSLLAVGIGADELFILTNVEKVQRNFGKPDAAPIDRMTPDEAQAMLDAGEFPPGSMGPKIEAAIGFVRSSPHNHRRAVLAASHRVHDALLGRSGTIVSGPAAPRTP